MSLRTDKVVLVTLLTTLLTACSQGQGRPSGQAPPATSARGPYLPTLAPPRTPAADCSASLPNQTFMAKDDGSQVDGLYVCTGPSVSRTEIHNVSTDAVWYFVAPGNLQWSPAQDADRSLKVQVFREGLRLGARSRGEAPLLTLEPGTTASVDVDASEVRLSQTIDQQAAWQIASTLVDTVEKKAKQLGRAVLVNGSRSRDAVLTCIESGYQAGRTLANAGDQPADQLATALGLREQHGKCADAIDAAEKAEGREAQAAALTREDLVAVTHEPVWEERGSVLLEDAARSLKFLVRR